MNQPSEHAQAHELQVAYFATRRPIRMLAMDTPYIRRHHAEVMRAGALQPGERICEWGSGLGRFSRLLLEDGLKVESIELSPHQSDEARQALAGHADLTVHCGDVADVLETMAEPFDAMVGYFMLHHLPELARYFRYARPALRPGGRLVFVEPNPYHPLYPVQIACTPGMRWAAEKGIYHLTPRQLREAALAAGFTDVNIDYYGSIPRAPYNWLAKVKGERMLEPLLPGKIKPFQTIVVRG